MFDIGWSEMLILGVVTLIVIGPKELPGLMRTVGRYMGIVKRQAAEFRTQFDDAMREAEMEQLKKDVEGLRSEVEGTMRDTVRAAEDEMAGVKRTLDRAAESTAAVEPPAANPVPALEAVPAGSPAEASDGINASRPATDKGGD